jgi:hypothetical protein
MQRKSTTRYMAVNEDDNNKTIIYRARQELF